MPTDPSCRGSGPLERAQGQIRRRSLHRQRLRCRPRWMPVRGAAPLQRTECNNSDDFAHAPLRRIDPHPRDTFDGEGFATIHRGAGTWSANPRRRHRVAAPRLSGRAGAVRRAGYIMRRADCSSSDCLRRRDRNRRVCLEANGAALFAVRGDSFVMWLQMRGADGSPIARHRHVNLTRMPGHIEAPLGAGNRPEGRRLTATTLQLVSYEGSARVEARVAFPRRAVRPKDERVASWCHESGNETKSDIALTARQPTPRIFGVGASGARRRWNRSRWQRGGRGSGRRRRSAPAAGEDGERRRTPPRLPGAVRAHGASVNCRPPGTQAHGAVFVRRMVDTLALKTVRVVVRFDEIPQLAGRRRRTRRSHGSPARTSPDPDGPSAASASAYAERCAAFAGRLIYCGADFGKPSSVPGDGRRGVAAAAPLRHDVSVT
jgi:hypothetical protein